MKELTLVIGKRKYNVKRKILNIVKGKTKYEIFYVNRYVNFVVDKNHKNDDLIVKVSTKYSKHNSWTPAFQDIESLFELTKYVSDLNENRLW